MGRWCEAFSTVGGALWLVDMDIVVFVVGLLLLAGGVRMSFGAVRKAVRAVRLRTSGVVEPAEILDRRFASDPKGDAPSDFFLTVRWRSGSGYHSGEFQVPHAWWELPEVSSVPVRVNPEKPDIAVIEHWSSNPYWKLGVALLWMVGALAGVALMFGVAREACSSIRNEFLEQICKYLELRTG